MRGLGLMAVARGLLAGLVGTWSRPAPAPAPTWPQRVSLPTWPAWRPTKRARRAAILRARHKPAGTKLARAASEGRITINGGRTA